MQSGVVRLWLRVEDGMVEEMTVPATAEETVGEVCARIAGLGPICRRLSGSDVALNPLDVHLLDVSQLRVPRHLSVVPGALYWAEHRRSAGGASTAQARDRKRKAPKKVRE